jgi:hypothetical protein
MRELFLSDLRAGVRRVRPLLAALLFFAVAAPADDRVDFSGKTTPTCELASLVAIPPPGWFNVPFENLLEGQLGCMMMLTNEDEEPVGVIRIRSLASPALKAGAAPFEALFVSEVDSVASMGYVISEEPLFVRDQVPVKGAGFGDGRGVGLSARIEGNAIAQEVQLLMFRSADAEYIITLLTPAKSHEPKLYERNMRDFGTLIRSLQPRKK